MQSASPRWATKRTDRQTYGHEAEAVARGLGYGTLLPWQRQVFDVALEHDEDGELVYRTVIITVPRQSGKTSGVLIGLIHRLTVMAERMLPVLQAMGRPDLEQKAYYTAQTGSDARAKLRNDWLPIIHQSMWDDYLVAERLSNGHELLMFSDTAERAGGWSWRGTVQPVSTSDASGHGRVTDYGLLDEIWKDDDDRREQALMPGMNTRPSPQLWIVSTMGTETSHYMNRKVADGRLAVERGLDHTLCYFEWSAADDIDPDDEQAWYSFMPALGLTTPVSAIRAARLSMSDKDFRRAYLNQMVASSDKLLPIEAFMRHESSTAEPGEQVTYAIDANPNRTHACLSVSDGRVVEVIENYTDLDLCAEDAKRAALGELGRPGGLAVDKQSPIASKVPMLERAGVRTVALDYEQVKTACAEMFDAILKPDSGLEVVPNESLRAAVEGAERKAVGDRFVWSRRKPTVDITPLTATTFARHAAQSASGVWSWMMN